MKIKLQTAAQYQPPKRIRSGVFIFDWATGGGVPIGKISVFWGRPSSGKSTIAGKIIAQAQKENKRCLWIDSEGAFNIEWAKKLGIDPNKLFYLDENIAEKVVDIVVELIQNKEIDVIVIDSLATLIPTTEFEEKTEKWQQALQARIFNKAVRKWVKVLNENREVTLILINQLRTKLGVMYGDPDTKPGGMGFDFGESLEVKFWAKKVEKENDEPIGINIHFKVVKNRLSVPYREGEFLLQTAGEQAGQVAEMGAILNLIKRYEIAKIWGGTITYKDKKYELKDIIGRDVWQEILNEILTK